MAFLELVEKVVTKLEPALWIHIESLRLFSLQTLTAAQLSASLSLHPFSWCSVLWPCWITLNSRIHSIFYTFPYFQMPALPLVYLVNYSASRPFLITSSFLVCLCSLCGPTYFYQSLFNHILPVLVCRADFRSITVRHLKVGSSLYLKSLSFSSCQD